MAMYELNWIRMVTSQRNSCPASQDKMVGQLHTAVLND